MDFKKSKIVACEPRPHYHIWIRFDDRLEDEVNLSHLVGKGVFTIWESIEIFNQVHIDLDPYVLPESLLQSSFHLDFKV